MVQRVISIFMITIACLCAGCKRNNGPVVEPKPILSGILPFNKNPSGYWQIGYSQGNSLVQADFRLCTIADTSVIVGLWHPAAGFAGYYPYTGQNRTLLLQADPTNSWAARPGEVVMEGSNTGQYSMLRFVAPISGTYRLNARFEGVHTRLSSTDVHVLMNDLHLFDDVINGYGGDPAFFPVTGPHPSGTYQGTLSLNKGDLLTFAVGYGPDKSYVNDTTGLVFTLELL